MASSALALTGFSSVIGQILLLRELIAAFNGNEMSMGIMLATWMAWTAAGSGLLSALGLARRNPRRSVVILECIAAASLPPTIWAIRAARSWLQAVPGELMGIGPMLLASIACLCLYCLTMGALFVAAASMLQAQWNNGRASSVAYMVEAAGSALGGIVAGFVLLRSLHPFQIAALVATLNLWLAALLVLRPARRGLAASALAAGACGAFLIVAVAPPAERAAERQFWKGFHLIDTRDSIYGRLAAVETGNVRTIYSNGMLVANIPDPSATEEAVHYALLEHPAPRRVLMIGGGLNGSIPEALKHPSVERVDYVELDPALVGMARTIAGSTFTRLGSARPLGPRVYVHNLDGRAFLRAATAQFDAIVVNLPDPETAQLNRFYTEEFFRSVRVHLAPGGVFAFELHAAEESLSPDLKNFLRCIQKTLWQVFPYTVAIPGDTIHFFASSAPGVLTEDAAALLARMRTRGIRTEYVREYFVPFRMMPDRMAQVKADLQPEPATPVNRDFAPVAYYFSTVLWSTQFNERFARCFRAAARVSYTRLMELAAGAVFVLSLFGIAPQWRRPGQAAAIVSVAATGFTLMALQVLLLLAFQSLYGYVYRQLAILIALGMAGIALGTCLAHPARGRALARTQLLLALSAPALIATASLLARLSAPAASWFAAQCLFPALAALAGALGGYQFAAAMATHAAATGASRGLGTLYAIDLIGGCLGALVLSAYLVPAFGFWKTAWFCAIINVAPVFVAWRAGTAPPGTVARD